MSSKPEILMQGKRFRVELREIATRDGGKTHKEIVVHPGSVVLLPLLDDGRIILEKNYRPSVNRWLWELPAGTREGGEDPQLCAARELEEETGYRAKELAPLFELYPAPGISDERMHVFVARGLEKTQQNLDDSEHIEIHMRTLDEVLGMIRSHEIEDAKTIASVLYYVSQQTRI